MKQKDFSYLSIFVILFLGLVIAGYFFNVEKEKAVSTVVSGNYDTIMKKDPIGQNKRAKTHYYTLALSWSPNFCESQKKRNRGNVPDHLVYQCGGTKQFGWVIHGLWPQNAKARKVADHPRFCQGDLPEVPVAIIEKYLPESPGAVLLQGEWEKHGACAFTRAEDYFAKQKELFLDLKLPKIELARTELFRWVKENNPKLRNVHMGASRNELYICYNTQFEPMDCPRTQFQ